MLFYIVPGCSQKYNTFSVFLAKLEAVFDVTCAWGNHIWPHTLPLHMVWLRYRIEGPNLANNTGTHIHRHTETGQK